MVGRVPGRVPGRAIGAFQTRVDSQSDPMLEEIANLQGASLARLSTPSTGPERVAQQQPRYEAARAAATAYGYEEEGQRGPVASLFDFLMRGQSATMGAATGLVGAQRYGDEGSRAGIGEAMRRFGQGLSGQEQYRFSDFTSTGRRIAAGEEVGLGQRGWNSALGFVIDTATDPLTYISFGGSIMGRMRAANLVRGKSAGTVGQAGARNEAREQLLRGIESVDFNPERFARSIIDNRVTRTDKLAFDLNRRMKELAASNSSFKVAVDGISFAPTSTIDDIIRTSGEIFARSGEDILRNIAADIAPDAAAMAYARRSAAGLRRWANENFGQEIGEAYFRNLPKDIQGGLRIRLPFARNADGTPIAFGVQGVGAGRMGDASPFLRRIEDMTQSGRDAFRELFEPALGKLSGKSGEIYYDAVIAATGRKVRTSKGTDGSTWVDYSFSNYADANRRELRTVFDKRFIEEHEITSQLHRSAKEKYGDAYDRSFVRYMYSTDEVEAAYASIGNFSDAEQAAINVAHSWRKMLNELGQDSLEVFGEAGMAFHFLTDYVPRIMNKQALAAAKTQKRTNKVSPRPGYTKHREQWAAQWEISQDGTAYVIKWMPNEDIAKINPNVFETDPTVWMSVYLAELRSSLNDQKIINMLRRNGMLTTAQMEKYVDLNEAEISRRIVELTSGSSDGQILSRIAQTEKVLAKYAPMEGDEFTAVVTELERLGVNFIRKQDVSNYILDRNIYTNIIDGTEIRQLANGRWQVFDKTGLKLRHNNRVTEDGLIEIGTAGRNSPLLEFDSYADAKTAWDNYQIVNREGIWQRSYLPDEFDKLAREISEINTNPIFARDRLEEFVSLSELEKADWAESWMKALARWDMDGYELVLTQSGQPAFARGMGKRNLVSEQERISPQFAEWLGNREYMNVQGIQFDEFGDPTLASQLAIKQKIAENMANDYAPAKFMQNIQRMFQATQAPQTVGGEIYNNFYKPLYAAQKAWMTLGRGPGFVIRNILGGSWNNWINAVGRDHTLKSAAVVRATRLAQVEVQDAIKKLGTQADPSQFGELYREAVKRQLSKSYSGQELDNILEAWYLFSKNGLAGNRDTARLYGELYRSVAGRGTRQQQRLKGQNFRLVEDTDGTGFFNVRFDEDMSRAEALLEYAAGENWWIRDFMAPKVEISEDYMRFAAFLKGIDEVGLEPDSFVRGYAASQFVKSSQFDYADLSQVEQTLKMLIPFYTWTRYNVPLQIRAIIHEPGKVAQALRVHESLGAMFGEEPDALSPSYVADRFGITIGEENPLIQMLPEWMRPKGDVTLGLTWGEPLSDINQLFRDPLYAARVGGLRGFMGGGVMNYREVAQQLNPIIAAASSAQAALGEAGRMDGRNVEEAPRWARALGLAREDPTEPGTFVSNRSILEAIRNTVPLAGQLERVIPYLGSERHEGRWTTSVISALFGLPVSTIDDWKRASEMDRRSTFIQQQMKAEFGPGWAYRNEMIRRLTAEGAPDDFIAALNLRDMGDNEVDVLRAVYTWRMMRRVEMLIENGVPEDEIVAALSVFVPEGSKVESLVQLMWQYVPKPPGDFETGVRQFGLQPISRRDLQELGLTTNDVRNMTEDEQRNLVYWVNRNKGWTGKR